MLGSHKKRNPAPAPLTPGDNQQAMTPRELPPLRTFVLRAGDYEYNTKTSQWERPIVRVVDAHGLGIDDARMIAFTVFFWLDPENKTQPAQATKLALNADSWDEVEEVNPLFPTMKGH